MRDFINDGNESDETSSQSSESSSGDDDVVCLSDESGTEKEKPKEKKNHGRKTRSNTVIPSGMRVILFSHLSNLSYLNPHFDITAIFF